MKNVIALLETQRDILINNLPIHEAEGNVDQAALEQTTLFEIELALLKLRE